MRFALLTATALLFVTAPAIARPLMPEEQKTLEAAVRGTLIDPDSARFQWLDVPVNNDGEFCGYVNSKNHFGGDTGNEPFHVYWDSGLQPIVSVADDASTAIAIMNYCRNLGFKW